MHQDSRKSPSPSSPSTARDSLLKPGGRVSQAQPAALDLSGFGLEWVSYIGKGHYATVQLVREEDTGETFVAKCVRLGQLSERDQRLANQEVFLLESLIHPLIVAYHDSFLLEGQDTLVILMEHCEGGDLRHAISQRASTGEYFSEEQVLTWISQVTLALQFIHQHQVLHRDLKCSNIFLVGSAGRSAVKLGDFGICRVFEGSTDIANTLVGTPYYMSPEVCSNQPYSYKSDIWSLGCVLYELCVLKHAFEHATLQGLVSRIKSGVYEPIPACYSEGLNELVASLITLSTELRPSIDEVCLAPLLRPWLDRQHKELPELAVLDPEARERGKKHRRSLGGTPTGSPTADWMGSRFSGQLPTFFEEPAPASGGVHSRPVLQPQDMSLVVAFRMLLHMAERGQTPASALHPLVSGPTMSRETWRGALHTFCPGLSQVEVSIFESALPRWDGGNIALSDVEAKLAEAGASEKMSQLLLWAKEALNVPASRLRGSMEVRDPAQSGLLPASEFQAVLVELAPNLSSEETMLMLLLADKSENGDTLYRTFADRCGFDSAMEDTAFYTCAAEDIQLVAAVKEAWC